MNHLIDPSFIRSLHNCKIADLKEVANALGISPLTGVTKTQMIQRIIDLKSFKIKWNDPAINVIDVNFDILPSYWHHHSNHDKEKDMAYPKLSPPTHIPPHEPIFIVLKFPHEQPLLYDIVDIFQAEPDPFIIVRHNKVMLDIALLQLYIKQNYIIPRHIMYIMLQVFELSLNSDVHLNYEISEYITNVFIPKTFYTMPILDSPHLSLQMIKMYAYQKSTVMWMRHVETLYDTEQYIQASVIDRVINIMGQPSIIFRNGQFFSEQSSGIIRRRVFAKGGILGHEMGIGKTACMISLMKYEKMTTNPRTMISSELNRTCLPINIIICPPHLVSQWSKEIGFMAPELNLYSVLSKVRWNTITLEMKHNADVIIIPYSTELISYIFPTLLDQFMIRRLIIDEGHEYIEPLMNLLYTLATPLVLFNFYRHAWFISGTPFSKITNIKYIFDLLGVCSEDSHVNFMSNHSIMQMMQLIYIHMTKEYVSSEIHLPKITIINKNLTMNKVEEIEYNKILNNNHMGRNKLVLFATDIMIDGFGKPDGSIVNVTLDINQYIQQRIEGLNIMIAELQKDIQTVDAILEKYDGINNSITAPLRNKKTRATNQLSEERGVLERYTRILKTVEETSECCICLASQAKDNQNWAMCNGCLAIICVDCYNIMRQLGGPISCPMCRSTAGMKLLTTNGGMVLSKWGTKATQMIADIKAIPRNEKVIVFSQFNEMLHKLRAVLIKENISAEYMNSHIYNRNAIINRFQHEDEPQVLLLSSVNTGSGLNLTMANHVIFMDIIDTDNIKVVEMIERQAICRSFRLGQTKDIHVTRYIMSNTVEEEIFKMHESYYKSPDVVGDV